MFEINVEIKLMFEGFWEVYNPLLAENILSLINLVQCFCCPIKNCFENINHRGFSVEQLAQTDQ